MEQALGRGLKPNHIFAKKKKNEHKKDLGTI